MMSPNETTILVVFAYVTIAWLKTVSSGNVTVMDVLWGMGFVLIAWTRFLLYDTFNIASIACLVCVNLWGLRLGYVLHKRTKNRGEDPRYVRMRETAGQNWWWISFLQVFLLQGVLLLVIALPFSSLFQTFRGCGMDCWNNDSLHNVLDWVHHRFVARA